MTSALRSVGLRALSALARIGRKHDASTPGRTLVFRASSLGDFACFLPCLQLLCDRHANHRPVELLILSRFGPIAEQFGLDETRVRPSRIEGTSMRSTIAGARELRRRNAFRDVRHVYYAGQSAEGFVSRVKKLLLLRYLVGWRVAIRGFSPRYAHSQSVLLGGDTPVADHPIAIDACTRCGVALPVDRSRVLSLLSFSSEERRDVVARLAAALPGSQRVAGIHAWAQFERKRWSLEHFRAAVDHLLARGFDGVALLGGPGDVESASTLADQLPGRPVAVFAGRATVRETMLIARECGIVVGNDGSPIHMASLMGVPCVSIFCTFEPAGLWEPVLAPCSRSVRPTWREGRSRADYGIARVPLSAGLAAIDDVLDGVGSPHEILLPAGPILQRVPIQVGSSVFRDEPARRAFGSDAQRTRVP